MILAQKVKAGVMLYAMLMSVILSLLLQFYMERVSAAKRQSIMQLEQAKIMLQLEMERQKTESEKIKENERN